MPLKQRLIYAPTTNYRFSFRDNSFSFPPMRSSFYWPGLVVAAASSSKASLLFPTQKNISLLTVSSRLPPLLRTQTTAYIRRTFSRSFSFRVAGGLLPSSTRRPLAIVAKGSASVGSTASNSSNKNSKMGGQTGHASSLPAEANFTRTIHTAACLIIGDEVLGGKVRLFHFIYNL